MKKTYNINLNGQVFCIDDDATNALQAYIKTLEAHYLQEEDGKEIMADIENRIAELFTEYLKEPYKQVININDIDRVVRVMGNPNDIIKEDTDNGERKKHPRKLYRDPDHRILGGVASGIAAYFSISIVLVRLLFILLTFCFGITIIVYITLWVITPMAVTAKEKLEMKGEGINVPNIEKNIREKYNDIRNKGKIEAFFADLNRIFTSLFYAIGKFIKLSFSILAVFILIGGVLFLCGIGWFLLFPCSLPTGCDYGGITYLINDNMVNWSKTAFALITVLPVLLLIYFAVKQLFHLKRKDYIPLCLIGFWFLGVLLAVVCTISTTFQFSNNYKEDFSTPIKLSSGRKQIVIKIDDRYPEKENFKIFDIAYLDKQNKLTETTNFYIERGSESIKLEIQKKAYGNTREKAYQNLQSIRFDWEFKNDTLILDRSFIIETAKWRAQQVSIRLLIPNGYGVIFKNNSNQSSAFYRAPSGWAFRSWEYDELYIMDEGQLKYVKR